MDREEETHKRISQLSSEKKAREGGKGVVLVLLSFVSATIDTEIMRATTITRANGTVIAQELRKKDFK